MGAVRRAWLTALVIVLLGVSFLAGYALHSSTTTTSTTSSTAVTTTSSSLPSPTWTAVWPDAGSSTRYATPTGAARGFAEHVLGMTSPVALAFQQGDTRSGEVPILSSKKGPLTTILVRQLTSEDTWWVLGAISANLEIASPEALSSIHSPLRVTGRSSAFEATINLALFQDGSSTPLARGTAMGGSMGEMGPFSATLTYSSPHADYGTLVLYTLSAKDGSVLEASAIRVRLR